MNAVRSTAQEICARLRRAKGKAELADLIYREIEGYTLYDLQELRGSLEREIRHLPPAYKRRLYPKMMEQLFGTHHALILCYRSGRLSSLKGQIDVRFHDYCDMVEEVLQTCRSERRMQTELFYYLLAAFNLFVRELPGHPVGTPFPGGFEVEMRDGEYLCPIREKEDDVPTSICPYCPAKQTESPGLKPF